MKFLKTMALSVALAASAALSQAKAETVRFWYHFDNPANPMADLVRNSKQLIRASQFKPRTFRGTAITTTSTPHSWEVMHRTLRW